MFLGKKLSSTGLTIYFSGILLAVIVLVIIITKFPEMSRGIGFCVFAWIWIMGFLFARRFPAKEE